MNRFLFLATAVAVFAVVIAGLAMVGGPAYARMEQNDRQRFQDLGSFGRAVHCHDPDAILPETLDGRRLCALSSDAMRDPVTEIPYEYRRLTADSFQVCAILELPDVKLKWYGLDQLRIDEATGRSCLDFARSKTGAAWR